MEQNNTVHKHAEHHHGKTKKVTGVKGSILSILIAFIASSHHWLHTLLLALGLTSLGAGILNMPPAIRIGFLGLSLIISVRFLFVAWKKRHTNRPAAWVYFISSLISIIVVVTAIPQFIGGTSTPTPGTQNTPANHANHQDMAN